MDIGGNHDPETCVFLSRLSLNFVLLGKLWLFFSRPKVDLKIAATIWLAPEHDSLKMCFELTLF